MPYYLTKLLSKLSSLFNKSQTSSQQVLKFIMWGILNNLLVIVVYELLLFFINYKAAALCVYAIGFIFTFFTNSVFVFNNKCFNFSNAVKYFGLYLFNCVTSYYGLIFFVGVLDFNPRICIFFVTAVIASLSFIVSKMIFKNRTT